MTEHGERAAVGGKGEVTGHTHVEQEPHTLCVARGGGRALELMDRHVLDLLSTE